MIHEGRLRFLNRRHVIEGRYVLYWMQRSQRSWYNHALEYAVQRANDLDQPLLVVFCLSGQFPRANRRHYAFMLQGLREVQARLQERGILFVLVRGEPDQCVPELAREASILITDRAYLGFLREWRRRVAEAVPCQMVQVEGDVVVPVEEASDKEEYTAGTFRPKIQKRIEEYLHPLETRVLRHDSLSLSFQSSHAADIPGCIEPRGVERVPEVYWLQGGESEANRRLEEFIQYRLDRFADLRNDPSENCLSNLSPFLHFGQISPLYVVLKVMNADSPGRDTFLEELIIRRELAVNFVYYNPDYGSIACLPDWARVTLQEHAQDARTHLYSLEDLEHARTHDPFWNAAQMEMVLNGKMHGYMRMYWGKKILEWSPDPGKAFDTTLYLNDKYSIDGRDPNGYAGVAWCFGKHDRAWAERPVFGKVRYMNQNGLKRKYNMQAYVERVQSIQASGRT
jgi:deoxyribodipyrimidine photo-lyase